MSEASEGVEGLVTREVCVVQVVFDTSVLVNSVTMTLRWSRLNEHPWCVVPSRHCEMIRRYPFGSASTPESLRAWAKRLHARVETLIAIPYDPNELLAEYRMRFRCRYKAIYNAADVWRGDFTNWRNYDTAAYRRSAGARRLLTVLLSDQSPDWWLLHDELLP